MGFLVSPGVVTNEIDLTTVIPSVSTTVGAFAGVFPWGPVNEPTLISNEVELVNRFGKPKTDFNHETFFTAADFLSYSNAMFVTRVTDGVKAQISLTGRTITAPTTNLDQVYAKYPGELGNTFTVVFANKTQPPSAQIRALFDADPEDDDHVNVAVVDTGGSFGESDEVVEIFENVSLDSGDQLPDGTNNFLPVVLERKSRFIDCSAEFCEALKGFFAGDQEPFISALTNGTDGSGENVIAQSALRLGYDKYNSAENIDVSLIMTGTPRGTAHKAELANYIIDNVAGNRKDVVVFTSAPKETVVNNAGSEAANIVAFAGNLSSSSYAAVDSGYKYRYDKYNDVYIWTPLNGDIAGLCARTDDTRDPWFSPAGYNRGNIKNVIKLAFNPNKAERDLLYKNRINPVISQPGQGTVLFGNKTLLSRPSAFDRINVRRLFIVLEKAISISAKSTLFEFNDEFTRAQFTNMIEPFLRDVQGRRGIYDFRVVCDSTNNTPEVIDRNEFVGDIYIKPSRVAEFIRLNFVSVRTGVEFEEIVGKF